MSPRKLLITNSLFDRIESSLTDIVIEGTIEITRGEPADLLTHLLDADLSYLASIHRIALDASSMSVEQIELFMQRVKRRYDLANLEPPKLLVEHGGDMKYHLLTQTQTHAISVDEVSEVVAFVSDELPNDGRAVRFVSLERVPGLAHSHWHTCQTEYLENRLSSKDTDLLVVGEEALEVASEHHQVTPSIIIGDTNESMTLSGAEGIPLVARLNPITGKAICGVESSRLHGRRMLIVDDENTSLTRRFLERRGYTNIDTESDPRRASARIRETPYDCVLTDFRMPGMSGDHLLEVAKQMEVPVRIIYSGLSTEGGTQSILDWMTQGTAHAFVPKTAQMRLLLNEVHAELSRASMTFDAVQEPRVFVLYGRKGAGKTTIAQVVESYDLPGLEFPRPITDGSMHDGEKRKIYSWGIQDIHPSRYRGDTSEAELVARALGKRFMTTSAFSSLERQGVLAFSFSSRRGKKEARFGMLEQDISKRGFDYFITTRTPEALAYFKERFQDRCVVFELVNPDEESLKAHLQNREGRNVDTEISWDARTHIELLSHDGHIPLVYSHSQHNIAFSIRELTLNARIIAHYIQNARNTT